MAEADEQRHRRSIESKVARLRERLNRHKDEPGRDKFIAGMLLGILDLLGDEL